MTNEQLQNAAQVVAIQLSTLAELPAVKTFLELQEKRALIQTAIDASKDVTTKE